MKASVMQAEEAKKCILCVFLLSPAVTASEIPSHIFVFLIVSSIASMPSVPLEELKGSHTGFKTEVLKKTHDSFDIPFS